MGKGVVVGGHSVHGSDGTQCAGIVVGASIPHDANRTHGQDRDEGLPDFIVKTMFADLVDIDRICLAQDIQFCACDFPRAADRKAWPWKRVASNKAFRETKLAPQGAHFIFKEFAQRLDEFQAHFFG